MQKDSCIQIQKVGLSVMDIDLSYIHLLMTNLLVRISMSSVMDVFLIYLVNSPISILFSSFARVTPTWYDMNDNSLYRRVTGMTNYFVMYLELRGNPTKIILLSFFVCLEQLRLSSWCSNSELLAWMCKTGRGIIDHFRLFVIIHFTVIIYLLFWFWGN